LAAAALTIPFRTDRKTEVDFLHPRLAPPSQVTPAERKKWLMAAVAVAALLLIAAIIDITVLERQISNADNKLADLQPALLVARPFVESMRFAESYRTSKPRYLACLKDLTMAITPPENTYFTSFNLDRDMRGLVVGHSDSVQSVLSFLDNLKSIGRFEGLQRSVDAHAARNSRNDVIFSVSFTYRPAAEGK
jgi:hypothetical protein